MVSSKIEEIAPYIKRFRMKPAITIEELIHYGFKKGGSWLNSNAEYYLPYNINKNGNRFSIEIGIPFNLNEWNDCDFIMVIDDAFLQPYTPFHNVRCEQCKGKQSANFHTLDWVIKEYNNYLSSLDFLEEISE